MQPWNQFWQTCLTQTLHGKNKREINIKVTFEQNEDRDDTKVDVSVVPKLVAVKSIGTRMAIGKNIKTGELYAEEYGSQVRGQMSMHLEAQETERDDSTKESTGKVVDLRAAR